MPAAVQVSAASNITFSGDTFTDLGEVGLGIGEDPDANRQRHRSGRQQHHRHRQHVQQ